MRRFVIGAFLVGLWGCSGDVTRVRNILEADGCTKTEVGGWTLGCEFGCGKDLFANEFQCVKNGHLVDGCVCSGFLKGYTIRY